MLAEGGPGVRAAVQLADINRAPAGSSNVVDEIRVRGDRVLEAGIFETCRTKQLNADDLSYEGVA